MIKMIGKVRDICCDVPGCNKRLPTKGSSALAARRESMAEGWWWGASKGADRTVDLCPKHRRAYVKEPAGGSNP